MKDEQVRKDELLSNKEKNHLGEYSNKLNNHIDELLFCKDNNPNYNHENNELKNALNTNSLLFAFKFWCGLMLFVFSLMALSTFWSTIKSVVGEFLIVPFVFMYEFFSSLNEATILLINVTLVSLTAFLICYRKVDEYTKKMSASQRIYSAWGLVLLEAFTLFQFAASGKAFVANNFALWQLLFLLNSFWALVVLMSLTGCREEPFEFRKRK